MSLAGSVGFAIACLQMIPDMRMLGFYLNCSLGELNRGYARVALHWQCL